MKSKSEYLSQPSLFLLVISPDCEHLAHFLVFIPMRFLFIFSLLATSTLLRGQIALGGKEFVRAPGEVGVKGEWVLYPKNGARTEGSRRWLTRRVLVELKPGIGLAGLKQIAGVERASQRGKYALVDFAGQPDAALTGAESLKKVPGVTSAEPMLARQLFRRFAE